MTMKVGNGLDLQGQRIQNMGDPSSTSDAATKAYVDNVANGLQWKQPVRVASTATVTISNPGTAIFDSITLSNGDRILLKNQTSQPENGIYTFTASGTAMVRAVDNDSVAEMKAATVFVQEGTANADKAFTQTGEIVTLGTTNVVWAQFGAGTAYTAGNGLTLTSTTFDVTNTDGSITVAADTVSLAAQVAGAGLTLTAGVLDIVGDASITVAANQIGLATGVSGAGLTLTSGVLDVVGDASITVGANSLGLATGVAGAGLTLTSGVLDVVGGTGITVAANSVSVSSVVTRQYAAAFGDGSTLNYVITHGLGTQDVQVTVRNASAPYEQILVDNEATSTTTVTLRFAVAPTTNQFRVIVQGAS